MNRKALYSLVWVCLGALVAFVPPALGQFAETTGSIQGTVKDPSAAVVPGAQVTLTGPAIAPRTITSDEWGVFRFAELPPATYTVAVTASGFRKAVKSGIIVEVGRRLAVDIQLEVGDVTEVVEVTAAAAIVDTTSSKAVVSIRYDIMDAVPKPRDWLALQEIAPGSRTEPAQGGFQIDGASAAENNYTIEGQDTTAIRTGLPGARPPVDFFREVTIKSSGYEAEHGGAMGGVVSAVIKSGGLDWHGSGIFYYRDSALDAGPRYFLRRNPSASVPVCCFSEPVEAYDAKQDDNTILEPGFEIGGPIHKDRLWFYGSYIPRFDTLSRTVNITSTSLLDGASAAGLRTFTRTENTHFAASRLDWQAADTVRAYASWHYAYRRARGIDIPAPDGIEGERNTTAEIDPRTRRPDTGFVNPHSLWRLAANWTPNPKLVISGGYGIWGTDIQDRGRPQGRRYFFINSNDNLQPPFTPAGPAFRHGADFSNIPSNVQTLFDEFRRTQGDVNVAYSFRAAGPHNLKGGFTYVRLFNDIVNTTNFARVDLYWGEAFTPNTSDEVARCAPIIAAFGSCAGPFGHYIVTDFQIRGDDVSSNNYGLYVQDSWTVRRGVTINAGVRFDSEYLPSYTQGAAVVSKPIKFNLGDKVAPRIGAAWDVRQNGKIKVYGSWGLFYDIMKYELPRGSFGGEYWHDCAFTLDTDDFNTIQATKNLSGFTCNNGTTGVTPGTFLGEEDFRIPSNTVANIVNVVDPDLKPTRQSELVFGGEWAMRSDIGLEVRFAHKRLTRAIEDVGILSPAGENFLISNPGEGIAFAPYRTDCPSTVPRCVAATDGTAPPINISTDNLPTMPKPLRNYDGLEVRLNKRFTGNWFLLASYTWSRLTGNYSGLVSTDEDLRQTFPQDRTDIGRLGRASPNVTRYFDEQTMLFDASGNPVTGVLPTDRTHTFKAFAGYRLNWAGMHTTISGKQLWYSGVPLSSRMLYVVDAPFFPFGRNVFADIALDALGNWVLNGLRRGVRTPMFTDTDLNLTHEFKLSSTNEALRLAISFNVLNLWNQANAITIKDRTDRLRTQFLVFSDPNCADPGPDGVLGDDPATAPDESADDPGCASGSGHSFTRFFAGFDPIATANAQDLRLDSLYGKVLRVQTPREIRISAKVTF